MIPYNICLSLSDNSFSTRSLMSIHVVTSGRISFFLMPIITFHCIYICLIVCLSFLGPHPWHMEVPRLGVESDPQPQAYARATAMPDPSCLCDLHHSSLRRRILSPLIKARDQTQNLTVPSRIHFRCTTTGTPLCLFNWLCLLP